MARIRSIKPEFWADEKLAPMDPLTRLVFLGLISMADDAGRLLDSVKLVDAMLFPSTDDTAREALANLARAGRIQRGKTTSGQSIIQIVNWHHQRVDHPNLKAAHPPILEGVTRNSRKTREALPTDSRPIPESIYDQRPTIYDLRPTTNDHTALPAAPVRVTFAMAWDRYPTRAGGNPRGEAEGAWKARIKAGIPAPDMLAGLERYRAYCVAEGTLGTKYVMQAKRFFGPGQHFTEAWSLGAIDAEQSALEQRAAAEREAVDRDDAWLASRRGTPIGVDA